MWLRSLCVFSAAMISSTLAFPAYPGLNQAYFCDNGNECPPGSSCVYSRQYPGNKVCYTGIYETEKRLGRCPTPHRLSNMGQRCEFDQSCGAAERCCSFPAGRFCSKIDKIAPEPNVTVIIEGSFDLGSDEASMEHVIGSVALIQSKGKNILFDTAGSQQKALLLRNLYVRAGLYPEDIDYLITSHGHADHFANINLFPDVTNHFDHFAIMGNFYWSDSFGDEESYFIDGDENLELIQTPGHTTQDTTLIVRNVPEKGTIAVTGDLFFKFNDYINPEYRQKQNSATSFDTGKWRENREKIACMADWIVPGHGGMFPVVPSMKERYSCKKEDDDEKKLLFDTNSYYRYNNDINNLYNFSG